MLVARGLARISVEEQKVYRQVVTIEAGIANAFVQGTSLSLNSYTGYTMLDIRFSRLMRESEV